MAVALRSAPAQSEPSMKTPPRPRERQMLLFEFAHALTERARQLDPAGPATALFAIVLALSSIGLVVQASHAATTLTSAEFLVELKSQAWFRFAGLATMLVAARIGPSSLRRFLPALWVLMVVLLTLVFVEPIGLAVNGSHRWINLHYVSFQPSELARIVVVMFVADRCLRLGDLVHDVRRGLAPTLALGMVPVLLVMRETDLGMGLLMLAAIFATMWVGGARPRHVLAPLFVIVPVVLAVAYRFVGYIRKRFEMFMGSTHNQQITDSFEAIAGGDFWGVGLARGLARNQGVPYLESDFAFAQIGEEFGLFGMLLVIVLWTGFLWYGLRLVLSIKDRFDALVSFGLLFSTLTQATLHIGVVAGLAPPKGMTLPFISHGGTSLIVSSLTIGLALGAARRTRRSQEQLGADVLGASPQPSLSPPLAL